MGYGLATAIFFWLASWLLGSERPARDAVVAVLLGVVTSYVFSHWLNVQLPTGSLGPRTRVRAGGEPAGRLQRGLLARELWPLAAAGVILGTLVGVLPGIGPALTIALLLPITFNFDDPVGAFILFAGIYAGGMYGGSTTSILLNTPGESSSVATAIEGFEMAKRGRGRAALATAAIGSFVAGTIGIVLLTLLAEPVASLAVKFRAEDYFALTLLAFASVTALTSRSLIRGFTSLAVGLLIGFVGIDQLTGQSRLTFGVDQLGQRHRHRDRRGRAVRGRRGAAHGGQAAVGRRRGGGAARRRARGGTGHPGGLAAVVEAVAARRRDRVPVRGAARGRRGGADLPPPYATRAAPESRRRVGRGCDRGRRRARGRQQRVVLGNAGAAADAGDSDVGDGRDHARRVPDLQPAAGPGALRAATASWCGR